MPPRAKHNFKSIREKKSSQRKLLSKLLNKSQIKVTGDLVTLSNKTMCASVKICPKFEIPRPVKLGARPEEYKDLASQTFEKIVQNNASLSPSIRLKRLDPPQRNLNAENIVNETPQRNLNAEKAVNENDVFETNQIINDDKENTHDTQTGDIPSSISPKKKHQGCKRKILDTIENSNSADHEISFPNIENDDEISFPKMIGLETDDKMVKTKKQKSILNYFNARPSSCV